MLVREIVDMKYVKAMTEIFVKYAECLKMLSVRKGDYRRKDCGIVGQN